MYLKKILSLITILAGFTFIGESFGSEIDVSGTYVGKRCTSSACKGNLSDLADSLIGGILGTSAPIFLVSKDQYGGDYRIIWYDKKKVFENVVLGSNLTFSASPTKGGGNDKIIGRFEVGNSFDIRFIFEYMPSSGASTYYQGKITDTDRRNKVSLASQDSLNDQIEFLNDEKNKLEKNMESSEKDHSNEIKELNIKIAELKKELDKPKRIDASELPNNVTVNENVNLRSKPNASSKIITTIKKGQKINNLIELGGTREWAFIATADGLIGYIKSSFIIDAPSDGQAPVQPSTIDDDSDIISLINPKWDSGKKNKQMSVNAPGFISLKGKINATSVLKVEVNGDEVEFNNNEFGHVLQISSGSNKIKIEAFEESGKTHGLTFIIKCP